MYFMLKSTVGSASIHVEAFDCNGILCDSSDLSSGLALKLNTMEAKHLRQVLLLVTIMKTKQCPTSYQSWIYCGHAGW